jgi:hypothetical protein
METIACGQSHKSHFAIVLSVACDCRCRIRWLDEGVAQWCELGVFRASTPVFRKWIPLKTLTNMDIRTIDDTRMVYLFYGQSASLVQYLIEQHGKPAFTKLCRQLRDPKSLDGALRFTYSRTVPNMVALEHEWSAWQATQGGSGSAHGTGKAYHE